MQFIVLSREAVEKFDCEKLYILISITDPGDTEPTLLPSKTRVDTLKLRFHDWDINAKELLTTKYKDNRRAEEWVFFDEKLAKEIVDFVNAHLNLVEVIAVNCAAGISRSAGVAASLRRCLMGDDTYFFDHYLPNSLVYSTIIKEWNNDKRTL